MPRCQVHNLMGFSKISSKHFLNKTECLPGALQKKNGGNQEKSGKFLYNIGKKTPSLKNKLKKI